MSAQDFRVLEAVEKGMQKHALVPSALVASLSNLRHGGTGKILSSLLRDKLLSHDQSCGYDGYRLTNAGYDIMALWNLKQRKLIAAMGDRIGTGKESDVYLAVAPDGQQVVLKFHRLGRTSFRNVKQKRDYFVYHQHHKGKHGGSSGGSSTNQATSWLFLSRRSALKEFAFMKALYNVDYPTPEPLGHNRHVVVMSLVRGVPLFQVQSRHLSSEQAASIFHQASDLAVRLAKHGLVHCDLNEFNLLVDLSGIQQTSMSQEHDPYVRHSGMSVAAESAPGMLSARGPWEPVQLQQYQPDQLLLQQQVQQQVQLDHDGDDDDEAPPQPVELLDNGEAKPIVTLIDFPQMVSTQHPNANELYERDMSCLYTFFTHKLQFRIPETDLANLHLTWESVQQHVLSALESNEAATAATAAVGANFSTTNGLDPIPDDSECVCLASEAQLRLDQELKASGYSEEDANRDSELYYYYNEAGDEEEKDERVGSESDHEDEEEEKDDEANDNENTTDLDLFAAPSVSGATSSQLLVAPGQLADLTRQQLQEQAKERVRLQLESQKKKGRQRGAFRKRNSNKTYLKGKRVYENADLAVA